MLEALVALVMIVGGLLTLVQAATASLDTVASNRESAEAATAARRVLEAMQSQEVEFRYLFAAYVEDAAIPAPEGAGVPALSRHFDVDGLTAQADDGDGHVGEILLPVAVGPYGSQLREDVAGRDLDGDGVVDLEDHADDYVVLPVTISIRWTGRLGDRQLRVETLLTAP